MAKESKDEYTVYPSEDTYRPLEFRKESNGGCDEVPHSKVRRRKDDFFEREFDRVWSGV